MKRHLRYPLLIATYGTAYTICELLWKGDPAKLHWSMFVLAAIGGIVVGQLNNQFTYDMDLLLQCLIGGIIVTIGEGIVGHIFNSDYSCWDYRMLPLSFWNAQINLFFSLIWAFVLCPLAIFIDDSYDYYLLKSRNRPYYILCSKVLFVLPKRKVDTTERENTMNQLQPLLDLAQSQVGYPEKNNTAALDSFTVSGSGNFTKYARDITAIDLPGCQGQPWCGVYQMWLEYKSYGKAAALGNLGPTFYNCFATMNWAKQNNRWLPATATPKPGFRVIFKQSHIALVTKVTGSYASGKLYTNEGNTSDGSGVNRDGGRVCNKSYPRSHPNILGYVIIPYQDSSTADTPFTYPVGNSKAGLTVTASALNIRSHPKTGIPAKVTYKKGDTVYPANKTFINGDAWFETDKGWIFGKYLEGWLQELSDPGKRWWYLTPGYTYPVSTWIFYNNAWYYLDAEGWMARNTYVKSITGELYYWLDGQGVWDGKADKSPDLFTYPLTI